MKLLVSSSRMTAGSLVNRTTHLWNADLMSRSSSSSLAAEVWLMGRAGTIDCGQVTARAETSEANSL